MLFEQELVLFLFHLNQENGIILNMKQEGDKKKRDVNAVKCIRAVTIRLHQNMGFIKVQAWTWCRGKRKKTVIHRNKTSSPNQCCFRYFLIFIKQGIGVNHG